MNTTAPAVSEIRTDRTLVTFINVFTVEPADQERLLRLLTEATEQVVATLPGFVSASFHRSLDGTRIVNYAQWESREAFEALFTNPRALEHFAAMRGIARSDRALYEVVTVYGPRP